MISIPSYYDDETEGKARVEASVCASALAGPALVGEIGSAALRCEGACPAEVRAEATIKTHQNGTFDELVVV